MPFLPAPSDAQNSSFELPIGLMTPSPVITTRSTDYTLPSIDRCQFKAPHFREYPQGANQRAPLSSVRFHVIKCILNGSNLLSVAVGDFYVRFLFKRHD